MSRVSGSQEERIAELEQALAAKEAEIEEARKCATEAMRDLNLITESAKELAEMLREKFEAPPEIDAVTLYAASLLSGYATAWKNNPPKNGFVFALTFPEIGRLEIDIHKIDGKSANEAMAEFRQRAEAAEAALEAAKLDTERLDAVEQGHWSVSIISRAGRWVVQRETQILGNIGIGRTPRAAIDAARESGKEPAYSEVEAERDRLQSELRKLKQERFHLAAANEQLALSVKALVEGLKQIQWGNDTIDPDSGALSPTVYSLCPMCDQSEVRGHSPDCVVGALVAEHDKESA